MGDHPYVCPSCGGEILAERFGSAPVTCPTCKAGPFETVHDCYYDHESGDEYCTDDLEPLDG